MDGAICQGTLLAASDPKTVRFFALGHFPQKGQILVGPVPDLAQLMVNLPGFFLVPRTGCSSRQTEQRENATGCSGKGQLKLLLSRLGTV